MDEAELTTRLIEWMRLRGPEDWHKVVASYSWDNGMKPLLWLVDQPDLDRATAHTIFWLTSPEYFLLGKLYREGGRDPWESGERNICVTLFQRFQSGTLTESRFATDHGNQVSAETWTGYAVSEGCDPDAFALPAWMHAPIQGMEVDLSEMDEGYPKHFFAG